jgi:hypothetical protein
MPEPMAGLMCDLCRQQGDEVRIAKHEGFLFFHPTVGPTDVEEGLDGLERDILKRFPELLPHASLIRVFHGLLLEHQVESPQGSKA